MKKNHNAQNGVTKFDQLISWNILGAKCSYKFTVTKPYKNSLTFGFSKRIAKWWNTRQ